MLVGIFGYGSCSLCTAAGQGSSIYVTLCIIGLGKALALHHPFLPLYIYMSKNGQKLTYFFQNFEKIFRKEYFVILYDTKAQNYRFTATYVGCANTPEVLKKIRIRKRILTAVATALLLGILIWTSAVIIEAIRYEKDYGGHVEVTFEDS